MVGISRIHTLSIFKQINQTRWYISLLQSTVIHGYNSFTDKDVASIQSNEVIFRNANGENVLSINKDKMDANIRRLDLKGREISSQHVFSILEK